MATATFKDLCIDASDPNLVARFWGDALGLDVDVLDEIPETGSEAVLRRAGIPIIWVNRVPEPKAVKNRVHLDLWVADDTELIDRGAVFLSDQGGFRVYADPEGNEFCAFPAPEGVELDSPARWFALCTDSDRPEEAAAWWQATVGGVVDDGPDGTPRWLGGAGGLAAAADLPDVVWKFVRVDDVRTVKNRWHWDVTARVDDLAAAGAEVLRAPDDEISWTVMADPQGNEFCAFSPVSD